MISWGTNFSAPETTWMDGVSVVGRTSGNYEDIGRYKSGIVLPATDFLQVRNVSFYDFPGNNEVALSTCANCFRPTGEVSGGSMSHLQSISFFNVNKKIYWTDFKGHAKKQVIRDIDGSFTDHMTPPAGVKRVL